MMESMNEIVGGHHQGRSVTIDDLVVILMEAAIAVHILQGHEGEGMHMGINGLLGVFGNQVLVGQHCGGGGCRADWLVGWMNKD